MKDTDVPASPCPYCGRECNGALDALGDASPAPGDFSVCLYCRRLACFGDHLQLRCPSLAELEEIERDPQTLERVLALLAATEANP